LGRSGGVSTPTPTLDFWNTSPRQAERANHNPLAASSEAIARNRCFLFIVFCFLIQGDDSFSFATALCADFWELAFDLERRRGILERRRGILVRNASEQE